MKHSFPLFFVSFIILMVKVPIGTGLMPTQEPGSNLGDVTLYDVYKGLANESHPMYWGNHTYFMNQQIFFCQVGGTHNHAFYHTVWNETVYITKITNCEFIDGQVIIHQNETWITLSNGTSFWKPCLTCPICGNLTHAAEFSPDSLALYYFCDSCRVVIGEDLGQPNIAV